MRVKQKKYMKLDLWGEENGKTEKEMATIYRRDRGIELKSMKKMTQDGQA
jgi:hypothetical protein